MLISTPVLLAIWACEEKNFLQRLIKLQESLFALHSQKQFTVYCQGCNLYKLSQKCNLYKLLGDTFYNFQTFCFIRNNTCMLSNFQSLFSGKPIDAQ